MAGRNAEGRAASAGNTGIRGLAKNAPKTLQRSNQNRLADEGLPCISAICSFRNLDSFGRLAIGNRWLQYKDRVHDHAQADLAERAELRSRGYQRLNFTPHPIAEIRPSHIYDLLEPIWVSKRETANRVRDRVETIIAKNVDINDRDAIRGSSP